jgi:hypothetical protein
MVHGMTNGLSHFLGFGRANPLVDGSIPPVNGTERGSIRDPQRHQRGQAQTLGGLATWQLNRVVDYIEQHLGEMNYWAGPRGARDRVAPVSER